MSKYDDKAAEALRQAKDDCQHPPHLRSIDRASADEFCMDCGRVTFPYVDGLGGRFPGDRAVELVTEAIKKENPGMSGRVILHYVEPVAADEFNVLIGLTGKAGASEWRHFKLVRMTGADSSAQVEQVRSFTGNKDKE